MDLIALVMDDHKLHVHRLNWQRLWVAALDDISVTALAWSWDGHHIILGTRDGAVVTVAAESGAVQRRSKLFSDGAAVVLLDWKRTMTQLDSWMRDCVEAWRKLCTEWAKASAQLASFQQTLLTSLENFGESGSAGDLFLALLREGQASDGLQQFLLADLAERGLRATSRAVDIAVLAIHEVLLSELVPTLQKMAFLLAELRGCVDLPDWAASFCVPAAEVQTIETFTLQLLISVDALRRDVVSDGAAYRAIFSWLLAVIQRLSEGLAADASAGAVLLHAPGSSDASPHWLAAHPASDGSVLVHRVASEAAPAVLATAPLDTCPAEAVVRCVSYGSDHLAALGQAPDGGAPALFLSPLHADAAPLRHRDLDDDFQASHVAVSASRRLAFVLSIDRVRSV
ncbi:hypothetical protein QBZ16_005190 [Prototheca wickerhamii]|uniref:Anaphase-promoting complex subunit 4 n=1 Tax=Prototheca wickerhamii TaxID=3111 RepID=A0AAD9IIY8_PROWI|nr:hypothetical protein QBZ16_005190 [Prototheca wickerhamii]